MTNAATTGQEAAVDAIDLLVNDHQEVQELFERYDVLAASQAKDAERKNLADEICTLLIVHAMVEEEIFYPAARAALDDDTLLNDAEVEHASAKELIARIDASDPSEPLFDSYVRVLGEYVGHHVQEEEGELFAQIRDSELDLDALGDEMAARQEELLSGDSMAEGPL